MNTLKWLVFLWGMLFFVSCATITPPLDYPWNTEFLRNGSVSHYRMYEDEQASSEEYWNHILVEMDEIVVIREITLQEDQKQIFRARIDKVSLDTVYTEIVAPEGTEQKVLLKGEKKGQIFTIKNEKEGRSNINTIQQKKEPFMESEILTQLMAAFPFGELSKTSIKTVYTRREWSGETFVEYLGTEEIDLFGKKHSAYRLYFSGMATTAWYMKEAPHLLLMSKQGAVITKLIQWNGI